MSLNTELIENLGNDIDTFIRGDKDSDVTLSDGHVMPSYRKFAISDLKIGGKKMIFDLQYYKGDIACYNGAAYLCINDCVATELFEADGNWTKLGKYEAKSGYGLMAYAEYDTKNKNIISSRGVESIYQNGSSLQIKLSKPCTKDIGLTISAGAQYLDPAYLYDETGISASLGTGDPYPAGYFIKQIKTYPYGQLSDSEIEITILNGIQRKRWDRYGVNYLARVTGFPSEEEMPKYEPILYFAFFSTS